MKIEHTEDYQVLRERAYPPLADFADALYWQAQGDETKMQDYLTRCGSVKQRYKKPEEIPCGTKQAK